MIRRWCGVAQVVADVMTVVVGVGRRRRALERGEKRTARVVRERGLYCALDEKYEKVGSLFIVIGSPLLQAIGDLFIIIKRDYRYMITIFLDIGGYGSRTL